MSLSSFIAWSPPSGLSAIELQRLRELALQLLAEEYNHVLNSIKIFARTGTVNAFAVNFAAAVVFNKVQEDKSLCFTDKRFLVEELTSLANAADAGTLTEDVMDGYISRLDAKVAEVCSQKVE